MKNIFWLVLGAVLTSVVYHGTMPTISLAHDCYKAFTTDRPKQPLAQSILRKLDDPAGWQLFAMDTCNGKPVGIKANRLFIQLEEVPATMPEKVRIQLHDVYLDQLLEGHERTAVRNKADAVRAYLLEQKRLNIANQIEQLDTTPASAVQVKTAAP